MKINQKLMLTIAVLLIGFVVTGFAYRQVLQITSTASGAVAETNEFARHAQQVETDLNQAQSRFNAFLLGKDLANLEGFESSISQAREGIDTLKRLKEGESQEGSEAVGSAEAEESLLADLAAKLETFYTDTYATAELQIALGLDPVSGLQGELREAAHALEATLEGLEEAGFEDETAAEVAKLTTAELQFEVAEHMLRSSLLTMRRHEKDFLQRREQKYVDRMAEEQAVFASRLNGSVLSADIVQTLSAQAIAYTEIFAELVGTVNALTASGTQTATVVATIPPLLDTMRQVTGQELEGVVAKAEAETTNVTRLFIGVLTVVGVIVAAALLLLSAGISRSLGVLQSTVQKVSEGDLEARTQMTGSDELNTLGKAFDTLLDERVTALVEAQRKNEQLNDSIIGLLQAVAQLSQKDLTVKVPVSEDVTGPVADALNLFTDETAKVLQGVTRVSNQVATASNTVKGQSDTVMALADNERQQVVQTSAELAAAADAMNEIAELAQAGNRAADEAIDRTRAALETVTNTVSGINATRDTIRETEKRIKRLGERSQEITGAVNLINNIAERTHILALNASMHAASAGEAGRGFAVVADEVQRLAENARQATEQIANLVSNIQTETQDTVATMNAAISQVVDGSRLAEQAGERMRETQDSTAALVGSVQRIAESSQTQAKVSNALRGRARQIEESTEKTNQQLQAQGVETGKLLDYAGSLVESVRVFVLPATEESAMPSANESAPPVAVENELKLVS